MLIPQFSVRWLLAVTTVCAVVFSIVGLAVRGHAWAAAVSIGIGSLVILVLIYGLLFAVVWVFSLATSSLGRGRGRSGQSPFRSESRSGQSPFRLESMGGGPPACPNEVPATPILVDQSPLAPEKS